MTPRALFGLTLDELSIIAAELGLPTFAARQMADWLYAKRASSIEDMTNLPREARVQLASAYEIGRITPLTVEESADGTRKYLFPVGQGRAVETAWIPDKARVTLCVSTQIGCRWACQFCATGRSPFGGNLSAGEILSQMAGPSAGGRITNLVFMGMGEPLDSPEATLAAVRILTSAWGYGWSPSRVTVSTVGVLPGLKQLLEQARCHVALSLHSPFPDERARLMPAEKAYPLVSVLEVLRRSDAFGGQRRLMIEIVLLRGVNDSVRHAKETARLLQGLPCRVNLISYNPAPGLPFEASDRSTMEAYQSFLKSTGRVTTIRVSRGGDIAAACGLLARTRPDSKPSLPVL